MDRGSQNIKTLLYIGDVEMGDINKYAKNRKLEESLKSEQETATADEFSFDVNWVQFKRFAAIRFDDPPGSLLRVGRMRVVLEIDGKPRFAGFLASRPARSGHGSEQTLTLRFYEHFARLSGDLVCNPSNINSPMRVFNNRPAHLYVQDLINEFKSRASSAGETLNWDWGVVNPLAGKSFTYKDFQTVSKAICDAMNNETGAGKFDVVFRADPSDYTHILIDIVKPRGTDKNIIIKYPSDGVYKLWSTDYALEETNDYASSVLISGNGEVGDPAKGEMTAKLGVANNTDFVSRYMYWRSYDTQSSLESKNAVQDYADKRLKQLDFGAETPEISMKGRPIAWGDYENMDNGLAIGDSFYFLETNDDGANTSGQMRIVAMSTDYNDNGIATVKPTLQRV